MLSPAFVADTRGASIDTAPLIFYSTEQCYFTPTPVADGNAEVSIGDPFFRSAYTLFKLDEYTISMAPASYHRSGSNVIPVGADAGMEGYPRGTVRKTKGVVFIAWRALHGWARST